MKNVLALLAQYLLPIFSILIISYSGFSDQQIKNNSQPRYSKKGFFKSYDGENISISLLEMYEMEFVYSMIRKHSGIKPGYYYEGCWARAQMIVEMLEANGITSGKAFMELRDKAQPKPIPKTDYKKFPRWTYHVAPFVQVRKGSRIVNYIIDPAISNKPIEHKKWLELVSKYIRVQNDKIEDYNIYFTSKYNIMPVGKQKSFSLYWGIPDGEYKKALKKGYIQQELQLAREFEHRDNIRSLANKSERIKKQFILKKKD